MFAMALERRSASINLATYEQTGATGGYAYVAFHVSDRPRISIRIQGLRIVAFMIDCRIEGL